eukprot:PLAT1146.1.p1 GENE.PLAT1146.1~~PLAT1146.1.p1  ORF type:complete len:300 (+),score=147.84 PLAT1146.1:50-949(+)
MDDGGASKLEPFCLLAKNAKGKACVALIKQVLNTAGIFVFGELLDMDNVKALEESDEHRPMLELLRLFAFGTYGDYRARMAELPELSDAQRLKLRQLTIVSLAGDARTLPYALLEDALAVDGVREVEDVIIKAIYAGIIRGKMNHRARQLEVTSALGRDVKPDQLDSLLARLGSWLSASDDVLLTLAAASKATEEAHVADGKRREEASSRVAAAKTELADRLASIEAGDDAALAAAGGGAASGFSDLLGEGFSALAGRFSAAAGGRKPTRRRLPHATGGRSAAGRGPAGRRSGRSGRRL